VGWLRHRVELQRKNVRRNNFGEEEIYWEHVITVWGSVEPLRGREFVENTQDVATLTTRIRLRYRQGVEPEWRVLWHDPHPQGSEHTYDILEVVNPLERQRDTILLCRELVGKEEVR